MSCDQKETISKEKEQAAVLSGLISEEIKILYEYSKEHNDHKRNLFKFSITVFSLSATVLIALIKIFHESDYIPGKHGHTAEGLILFLAFLGMGLINLSIVNQYIRAHIAVLFCAAQVNLLRKSKDLCVYALLEQGFSSNSSTHENPLENFQKYFGRFRTAPTDNKDLINRTTKKFWGSSGGLTIVTMSIVSSFSMLIPLLFSMVTDNYFLFKLTLPIDMYYVYGIYNLVILGRKEILNAILKVDLHS